MTVSEVVSSDRIEPGGQASLINQAARSVKWSFLYNATPRLVTPFSTMILAALLTPVDFGLVAIATVVITLAQIGVDLGLSKAVIQHQTHVDEAASISLWTNLLMTAGLYLALWIAAPWISAAYNNDKVIDVIRVAALFLPLTALATIPKALMQRNMMFSRLFWVNSAFLIFQAVVAVVLAAAGAGYWALILGQLVGMTISTGLAWGFVHWRPLIVINWPMLRSLLKFSVWVMVSGFLNWLLLYADRAIAGLFLDVQRLGVYSLGFTIAIVIPAFFVAALSDVAYPTFCRMQGNPQQVGHNLVRLQALAGAILFPIAFGIAAVGPSAVDLLYGQKWAGLGTVMGILVIMPGLSFIWLLNQNAYQSVGRPDVWTKLAGYSLLALLPLLWVAAPYGLLVYTFVRFGGALLLPLGNIFFGARVLRIGTKDQIKVFSPPFCFAVIMFVIVSLLTKQLSPFEGVIGWIKLISIAAAGAGVYFLLLRQLNRGLWDQLLRSVRRVLS
jgi:PST family polysaccharide transporter